MSLWTKTLFLSLTPHLGESDVNTMKAAQFPLRLVPYTLEHPGSSHRSPIPTHPTHGSPARAEAAGWPALTTWRRLLRGECHVVMLSCCSNTKAKAKHLSHLAPHVKTASSQHRIETMWAQGRPFNPNCGSSLSRDLWTKPKPWAQGSFTFSFGWGIPVTKELQYFQSTLPSTTPVTLINQF